MALKGSNKTEYQRKYMRKKRDLTGMSPEYVRPTSVPELPSERVAAIKVILARRKELGCPDDSKARWQRALGYRVWELNKEVI